MISRKYPTLPHDSLKQSLQKTRGWATPLTQLRRNATAQEAWWSISEYLVHLHDIPPIFANAWHLRCFLPIRDMSPKQVHSIPPTFVRRFLRIDTTVEHGAVFTPRDELGLRGGSFLVLHLGHHLALGVIKREISTNVRGTRGETHHFFPSLLTAWRHIHCYGVVHVSGVILRQGNGIIVISLHETQKSVAVK